MSMHGFPLVLNTVTIKQAGLEEKFRLTAEAGFEGLELWDHEIGSDPAAVCATAHKTAQHVLAKAACQGR